MTLEYLWWLIEASWPRTERLNYHTQKYLADLICSNGQAMKYIKLIMK